MIKINLLPVKAAKRREQGQTAAPGRRHRLLGDAASASSSFTARRSRTSTSCASTTRSCRATSRKLKAEIGDYDLIKAQRDELIRQRDAIKRLQANRSGPTYMMRELSDILTPGKGPTFNKEQYEEAIKRNPNAGVQPELGHAARVAAQLQRDQPRREDPRRAPRATRTSPSS